jgi:hypothetical protein
MTLTLSCDHRILYGADAALFLAEAKGCSKRRCSWRCRSESADTRFPNHRREASRHFDRRTSDDAPEPRPVSTELDTALAVRDAIADVGLDMYEPLAEHPRLVYARAGLEALLTHELVGQRFEGPVKTRAKAAKQAVANALGYPIPPVLRNTKPRFPGQDLDVYVQQSSNLQIYNDEITPSRRYAVLGLDARSEVAAIRVIEGVELAALDKTGTLTSKYQARRRSGAVGSSLASQADTDPFVAEFAPVEALASATLRELTPSDPPTRGAVIGIASLHQKLLGLVGQEFEYSPSERRRGDTLHRAACKVLELGSFADTGHFPDIVCQALEVKLQLARTIDLGLVSPDSQEPAVTLSPRLRHCDARYLVAYAVRGGMHFRIEHLVTSTGVDFFDEFHRFGGLVQNQKLQIKLPRYFFEPK